MSKLFQTLSPDLVASSHHGESDKPSISGFLCHMYNKLDLIYSELKIQTDSEKVRELMVLATNLILKTPESPYNNHSIEDMENEKWKSIKDYEGYYEISNLGRIKSKKRVHKTGNRGGYTIQKESILCQYIAEGYPRIRLWKDNKLKRKSIHRLVALSFVPNLSNKKEVNHIYGLKVDNRYNMLEWNTLKENMQHSHKNKLIIHRKGENHHMSKLTEQDILFIRQNCVLRSKEFSAQKLATRFGVSKQHICRIITNTSWIK